jgi:cell division protein FtsB
MKLKRGNALSIVGIALVVYLGFLVFQVVKKNYELSTQINTLGDQINQLTDQKDELNYKVQYYQTDSFKEKEARAKLGLQAPGEGVIILPPQTATTQANDAASKPKPANFHQWWSFLFG